MRLLLIEDNDADADLIEQSILESGMTIEMVHVKKLAEGMERCKKILFDVVLLDLGLPDSQGLVTLQRWREHVSNVPVVALSGRDNEAVGIQAVHAGAQDYLAKDKIDADSLTRSLLYAIERHRAVARQLIAEKKSLEAEKRFRQLFDHSPSGIVVLSWNSRIIDANPAACRLLGFEKSQIIDQSLHELTAPEYRAAMQKTLQGIGSEGKPIEGTWWDADGIQIPVEVQSTVIEIDADPCLLLHVTDISQRKTLEAELQQAQKLEAIGQLAGGVAHDFNNLLTIINGYCEMLMTDLPGDNPDRNTIFEISKAGDKAARLTRQLLAFSRKQMLQPTPLDMNHVVTDMKKLIGRLIGPHIQVHATLESKMEAILADPGQMEQIIVNLAINARDAMPDGGEFHMSTRLVEWGEDDTAQRPETVPGRYVELTIRDTGCGIKKEHHERIFEPFFTTKEVGKGTGLGLATVYGIVKQSNGFIYFNSEEDKGTAFSLYFPVIGPNAALGLADLETSLPKGKEIILVVEDEDAVRMLAQRILERCGFTVLDAANGEKGLEIADEREGRIDLVLTDLLMPKMSGREMADRLQAKYPDLRIVFVSGYTSAAIHNTGLCDDGIPFLQKPFTAHSLAQKVRACLDA